MATLRRKLEKKHVLDGRNRVHVVAFCLRLHVSDDRVAERDLAAATYARQDLESSVGHILAPDVVSVARKK